MQGFAPSALSGRINSYCAQACSNNLKDDVAEMHGEAEALVLRSSARTLILPGGMSESFQVLVQKVLER